MGWVGTENFNIWVGWVGFDVVILFYHDLTKSQVEVDDHAPSAKNSSQSQQMTSSGSYPRYTVRLSLDQTSYRGCKRDSSGNTSCQKTACIAFFSTTYSSGFQTGPRTKGGPRQVPRWSMRGFRKVVIVCTVTTHMFSNLHINQSLSALHGSVAPVRHDRLSVDVS